MLKFNFENVILTLKRGEYMTSTVTPLINRLNEVVLDDRDAGFAPINDGFYEDLRDKIIYYRKRDGLTQRDLALLTGITQANISKIENGQSSPSLETLIKIANAFNLRLVVEFAEVSER